MRTDIVFTLTGPDRVGIVENVTRTMLDLGGNVGTSRMARLGGQFAILMLVSVPAASVDELEGAFATMVSQGYKVTTDPAGSATAAGGLAYRIDVEGADHEGIVHQIAAGLSQAGINIESMETGMREAPVTGTPLFFMSAVVTVSASVAETDWMSGLVSAGDDAGVDVQISLAETL